MAACDFVVKYDPEKDSQLDLTKRILYTIIVKRLKANKPSVMFIGGDSGEGKSLAAIRLQELVMDIQKQDINDFFETMNVNTPLQYPEKVDKLLFDKQFKKANIVCLHEAREVIKAKMWNTFLVQSVADINAMSRTVKRLFVIIVSQFIRDISTDIRYTLRYYCIVRRPTNKQARLYVNVMWKDDRDLEKPKLRKRKLQGYIVLPNGKYRRFIPEYFELGKPSKELIEKFEKMDFDSKSTIIKSKLNKLVSEMQAEVGDHGNKLKAMLDYYGDDFDKISLIARQYRGKLKLKPQARDMHDLSRAESNRFEEMLNERFKKRGMTTEVKNE